MMIFDFPWWLQWNHVGTPLIAIIATYIAVEQYSINRRQYRLALFKKRMAIFNTTAKFIATVVQTANVTVNECAEFLRETRDHEFLFGREVGEFINEVYRQGTALHAHMGMGVEHVAQQQEIMEWFAGKIADARTVFAKYLDFRKP
jgi:hypothetical protein